MVDKESMNHLLQPRMIIGIFLIIISVIIFTMATTIADNADLLGGVILAGMMGMSLFIGGILVMISK